MSNPSEKTTNDFAALWRVYNKAGDFRKALRYCLALPFECFTTNQFKLLNIDCLFRRYGVEGWMLP
jgi:hypothetical protein